MCDDLYVNEHFENSKEIEFNEEIFFSGTREPWFTFYSSAILIYKINLIKPKNKELGKTK